MADWELFYSPTWDVGGRGEYVRLIFEEAGIEFKEVRGEESDPRIQDLIEKHEPDNVEGWPVFAVPYIENRKTGFRLSQTPVICE